MADIPADPSAKPGAKARQASQYWVVNNSPPGSGPGGAAYTSYAIVRGTLAQAQSIPNAGGISGPYNTLQEAYNVYKNEPQNQDVSTLTKVLQYFGTTVGFLVYGGNNPAAAVQTGAAAANPTGWLQGIAHWIGVAVASLTDVHMWISIGWLLLGLVLLITGIIWWARQNDLVPDVVPVPV